MEAVNRANATSGEIKGHYLNVTAASMEDMYERAELVKDRMDKFYQSNPGLSSRVANHIDFPDYSADELLLIAKLILVEQQYRFSHKPIHLAPGDSIPGGTVRSLSATPGGPMRLENCRRPRPYRCQKF